jgi:hypothetical protein
VLGFGGGVFLVGRDDPRLLAAERDALRLAEAEGVPAPAPRAHLARVTRDEDGVREGAAPRVRRRLLRIWAAVSTPLLIALVVWLLVGNSSHYYWLGALVGILAILGFESLARGRLLAFMGWSVVFVVGLIIVIGLLQEWRLTLGVLLAVGAVVLLTQNLRELRAGR